MSCYDEAIALGFTELEAKDLQASKVGRGQSSEALRRLAGVKGLLKPAYLPPKSQQEARESEGPVSTATQSSIVCPGPTLAPTTGTVEATTPVIKAAKRRRRGRPKKENGRRTQTPPSSKK